MDITVWYYGVLDGITMRAPINLRTREIDWSRAEPYTEPPLTTPIPVGLMRFPRQYGKRHKKRTGNNLHWQRNKDFYNANRRRKYAQEQKGK